MSGDRRWAVVNRSTETGESVRLFETPQEPVAKLVAGRANAYFAESSRPYESVVIDISGGER